MSSSSGVSNVAPLYLQLYLLALPPPLLLGDGGQDPGRLLPAHHRDTGVRPHIQKPKRTPP